MNIGIIIVIFMGILLVLFLTWVHFYSKKRNAEGWKRN